MSHQIKVRGIVVDQAPMGEKDLRLVILSREAGKLPILAKGAKSQAGRFSAPSQLFTVSDFVLERGRTFYYIKEYELKDTFFSLRTDIDRLTYASVMLELARVFALDGEDNSALFSLLYLGLKAMEKEDADPFMISQTFLLRLASDNGFQPELSRCLICGRPYDPTGEWFFSVEEGGLICGNCLAITKRPRRFPLRQGSVSALRYITGQPASKVYRFKVSEEIRRELKDPVRRFVLSNAGITLKSLEFAENLELSGPNTSVK